MVGNHEMEMNHEAMRQAVEFYLKEKALNKEWAANLRVSEVDRTGDGYSKSFKIKLETCDPNPVSDASK